MDTIASCSVKKGKGEKSRPEQPSIKAAGLKLEDEECTHTGCCVERQSKTAAVLWMFRWHSRCTRARTCHHCPAPCYWHRSRGLLHINVWRESVLQYCLTATIDVKAENTRWHNITKNNRRSSVQRVEVPRQAEFFDLIYSLIKAERYNKADIPHIVWKHSFEKIGANPIYISRVRCKCSRVFDGYGLSISSFWW